MGGFLEVFVQNVAGGVAHWVYVHQALREFQPVQLTGLDYVS